MSDRRELLQDARDLLAAYEEVHGQREDGFACVASAVSVVDDALACLSGEESEEPEWQAGDVVRDSAGAVFYRSERGGWLDFTGSCLSNDSPTRPLVRLVPEGSEREALTREIVEHAVEVAADPAPPVTYDDAEGDLDYRERHGPPLTPGMTVTHRDGRLGMYTGPFLTEPGARSIWRPFGQPDAKSCLTADLRPVSLVERPERRAFRETVRLAHAESDSVAALANRIYDAMFGPGEPS